MRSRHINFAVAIAISLLAHLLLWPASKRIHVAAPEAAGPGSGSGEITLVLNAPSEKKAPAPTTPPPSKEVEKKPTPVPVPEEPKKPLLVPKPPPVPKPPAADPPDDMGEATGKGTGAQSAKGDTPLRAPEADQDQAFLSRDPVGMGRVGDPPTFFTGPRGENGSGGQRGGSQSAPNPAHTPSHQDALAMNEPAERAPAGQTKREAGTSPDKAGKATAKYEGTANETPKEDLKPVESLVRGPQPEVPSVKPPTDVAPPMSKTSAVGSAVADLNRPAADEIKAAGPLAQVATIADGTMALPPNEAFITAAASPAVSSAPPTRPDALASHKSVVIAPQLPLPTAAVLTPPPPAVEAPVPRPRATEVASAKPAVAAAVAPPAHAPALPTTGDGMAPGQQRASADPAQESDSESDPFSKTASADILHDGRLEVRQGRKVKTTRPHFLPGAEAAFFANPDATVVLKIAIDETGKVKSADIVRSAGSIEIDQPCRVAVYDWWFEPTHNKAGKPVADVVMFTIHFR